MFHVKIWEIFQIVHDSYYLYVFAPDNDCRLRWVKTLKDSKEPLHHYNDSSLVNVASSFWYPFSPSDGFFFSVQHALVVSVHYWVVTLFSYL